MKKLLLISSVLVVMMFNIVSAAEFNTCGIEWTDTPDQIKEKLINAKVLGKYSPSISEGPFQATYYEIVAPYCLDSSTNHLKGEKILEEVAEEQKVFYYMSYYTNIYTNRIELRKDPMKDENGRPKYLEPTQAEIFYSKDTNEVFGYALNIYWLISTPNTEKEFTKSRIKKYGPPTKIINEGSEYYETYKWEKNGELLYIAEDTGSSGHTTMVFVNVDKLRKHIKRIKKKAKKEGVIK